MGCDPKAILYYGIELGDEEPEKDGDDSFSISEKWAELRGPKKPKDKGDYRTPEWDAWREANQEWKKTPENVEIGCSGYDASFNYYVHCAALEKSVEWNEQLDLGDGGLFSGYPEADRLIQDFCNQFGIPYKQPTWHLASLYF